VSLYKALGGGWSKADVSAASATAKTPSAEWAFPPSG